MTINKTKLQQLHDRLEAYAPVFACVRRAEAFLQRPGAIEREFATKVVKS